MCLRIKLDAIFNVMRNVCHMLDNKDRDVQPLTLTVEALSSTRPVWRLL